MRTKITPQARQGYHMLYIHSYVHVHVRTNCIRPPDRYSINKWKRSHIGYSAFKVLPNKAQKYRKCGSIHRLARLHISHDHSRGECWWASPFSRRFPGNDWTQTEHPSRHIVGLAGSEHSQTCHPWYRFIDLDMQTCTDANINNWKMSCCVWCCFRAQTIIYNVML